MLHPIPALNDNYIWCYAREDLPWIVIDPAQSAPVLDFLSQYPRSLEAILLTHNHDDHVGGVEELHTHFPNVPIYGPVECKQFITHIVTAGEYCTNNYQISVINSGGHTAQHLSYYIDQHLFCGDTIFAAGCGRVFTQDYEMMFDSLQRLNRLPAETIVCPAHEYTLSNIAFANTILTDKTTLKKFTALAIEQRNQQQPTLPTTLALERQINPFLQCRNLQEFIKLRKMKDNF